MKKFRNLFLLLGVLVLFVGVYFAVTLINKDPEPIALEEISIFSSESDNLASLSWDYNGETITLLQGDDGWYVDGVENFPLDTSFPRLMATQLNNLIALSNVKEYDPNPATYGLDKPVCTIRASTKDGREIALNCGLYTSTVGGHYLTSSSAPDQLYIVAEDLIKAFSNGLFDMIKKETLPSMSGITGLEVTDGDHHLKAGYIEENAGLAYSDEYYWFTQTADGLTTASINKIVDLVGSIATLQWQSCVSYDASEKDLAAYGLTDQDAARISIGYTDSANAEQTLTLLIGNYSGSSCYARLEGSSMVYLIAASSVDSVLTANAANLTPDDICLMDWDSVAAMDIIVDGKTHTITFEGLQESVSIDGEKTEHYAYSSGGKKVDTTAMDTLLATIHDMKAIETVSDASTTSGRTQAVTFVMKRNTDVYPDMTLTFYEYNAASYLVTLTDQPNRLADSAGVATMLTQVKTITSSLS